MKGTKKIIAVCTTKVQSQDRELQDNDIQQPSDDLYYNCHLLEVFVCANDAMVFV